MKDTIVSVIIPCYNCKEFLGETLDSLENQTQKDFEVVCINDGSTDDTLTYLYEQKEKRNLNLTVIDKENGGVSSARNKGIEAASGEYLLFLDADDIYHKQFIEKMLKPADKHDVVYCRLSRDLDEVRNFTCNAIDYKSETQENAAYKLLYKMGEYGFYCYLYNRKIIDEINLRFDETTKRFEDREFNWKYLCHCNTIAWVDAPLYGYRINENSVTAAKATWRTEDGLTAVKRTISYVKEHNCPLADEIGTYLYARVMWALAKSYSASKRKDLFIRLITEYDVKTCMQRTAKDNSNLVKIASKLYLIHPMLFYYAIVCGSKLF